MVRGETDKKANDFKTRHLVARDMERYVGSVEAKRKTKKWAIEEPKLDNARKLRDIHFVDPDSRIL